MLKIKNEGQYDSYVNVETIGDRVCTSVDGEMTTLQEEACDNFKYSVDFADSSSNEIDVENQFLLSKGDYMIVCIDLYNYYGTQSQPDGAMDIIFPDLKFTFSTTQ